MANLGSIAALTADIEAKVTTNGANENTGARVQTCLKNITDTLNALLDAKPNGLPYRFSTGTTGVGIGSSYIRVNNATVGAVTEMYIHQEDMSVSDRGVVLATLSAGGLVYLNSQVDGNTVAVFKAASVVDSGSYYTVSGTLSGVLPNDNDEIRVTIAPVEVTGVKKYKAYLTQTGTNAPVADVFENTLGGTLVWAYANTGIYTATLSGAFASGNVKTPISIIDFGSGNSGYICSVQTADNLVLNTFNNGSLSNGVLGPGVPQYFEVEVWP